MHAVQSKEAVRVLEYSGDFKKLVGKLPSHLHDRWSSIVLQTKDRGDTVKFSQLVDFVKKETKKANDPTFGRDAIVTDYKEPDRRGPRSSVTSQRAKGSFTISVSEPMQNSQLHAPSGRPRPDMSSSASSVELRRDASKPVAHAQLYTRPADIAFKQPCRYSDNDKHSL